MDAQTLLQTIDIWCQWDATFGEYADELRQYFTVHPDALQSILQHMLTSRGKQPTRKWLCNWTELKTIIPAPLMCHLMMGLSMKTTWYKSLANEADTRMLVEHERGQLLSPIESSEHGIINRYGAHVYAPGSLKKWCKEGATWYECLVSDKDHRLYKIAHGACWALVDFPDVQVRDLLMSLIRIKHRQSAVWPMVQWADEDAVMRLLQIQQRTRDRGTLTHIDGIMPDLASKHGMTAEELKDRAIFTYGLNVQGECTWHVDEFTLHLGISPAGRMQRSVRGADGKMLRQRPAILEEQWQLLAEKAKMLSWVLAVQKKCLAAAMKERRIWSYAAWQGTIAAHQISRHLARRLVWGISLPDDTHYAYACFDDQGNWRNAEGEAVLISDEHRLRIVHPVEMTPEEHSRWQRSIVTHKIIQPFKQIFRETYVLTPAEEQTRTYSNRFSTHVIPYDAIQSAGHRGWSNTWSVCWHDFQSHNIRAYLWTESNRQNTYKILRQIAFYPLDHGMVWSQPRLDLDLVCLPLREIPPIIFSEAMHDIDQYLVRESQGTRQQWDVEETRLPQGVDYAAQARQRELLLRELLPLLDLGSAVRVEGRLAHIDGIRCSYKVDLGSGTIYTEPGGRYLCIVPRYDTQKRYDMQKLYLPFEKNDLKTAEIISKILLLANDENITDSTILRQLPAKMLS